MLINSHMNSSSADSSNQSRSKVSTNLWFTTIDYLNRQDFTSLKISNSKISRQKLTSTKLFEIQKILQAKKRSYWWVVKTEMKLSWTWAWARRASWQSWDTCIFNFKTHLLTSVRQWLCLQWYVSHIVVNLYLYKSQHLLYTS